MTRCELGTARDRPSTSSTATPALRLHRCALALAALVSASPGEAQDHLSAFGWFGELAGACWQGTLPDAKTVHRQCYSLQFGRFLRGTAALGTLQEGQPLRTTFEGDSVFAWNPVTRTIDYFIWSTDGTYRQLQAVYEDQELHFPVPSRTDPTQVALRSSWRRIDKDAFEVRRQRPEGQAWRTELTVVYRRQPAP